MRLFLLFGFIFLSLLFLPVTAQAQTTILVTNTGDSGVGSLRNAVLIANNASDLVTIRFDRSLHGSTITLTSAPLQVNSAMIIAGPGADLLTVDADGAHRVFEVSTAQQATISDLTLRNGFGTDPNDQTLGGGCVLARTNARLTLRGVHITDCLTALTTSAVELARNGGAVYLQPGARVDVSDSTIGNSTAGAHIGPASEGGNGGGFYVAGSAELDLLRSTVSGNRAGTSNSSSGGDGGGIYVASGGQLETTSTTITDNAAGLGSPPGEGGGVYFVGGGTGGAATNLFNTILAGNTNSGLTLSTPDWGGVASAFPCSSTHTLVGIDNSNGGAAACGEPTNQVGTDASPVDPYLGPLQDNGGTTPTHEPFVDESTTIDNGSCNGERHDQRYRMNGATDFREFDYLGGTFGTTACDIGAVEFNPTGDSYGPSLRLTLALAGPYLGSGQLRTTLSDNDLLPQAQPYTGLPWNHLPPQTIGGTTGDSGVTDWVLISLMVGDPNDQLYLVRQTAGLLKTDGTVIDPTNTSANGPIIIEGLAPGPYYIRVEHRNHLPLLSNTSPGLSTFPTSFNFRGTLGTVFGTNGMVQVGIGRFGAWAGESVVSNTTDNQITLQDRPAIQSTPTPGYWPGDLNFDGVVDAEDVIDYWVESNGAALGWE